MVLLIQTEVAQQKHIRHEVWNDTVKWKDRNGRYVSLNVSEQSKTRQIWVVTEWLDRFFRRHVDWRAAVKEVATKLREEKHMAIGNAPVGDTLKSAPMAILCAALIFNRS